MDLWKKVLIGLCSVGIIIILILVYLVMVNDFSGVETVEKISQGEVLIYEDEIVSLDGNAELVVLLNEEENKSQQNI